MTFPTSFGALFARRDQIDGLNDHIPIGNNAIQKRSHKIFSVHQKPINQNERIINANKSIFFSSRWARIYFTKNP